MTTSDDTPFASDPLREAALRRTAESPAFVGFWLARCRERERLSEQALLARLKVKYIKLPLLALCSTPRSDHFAADVRAIAEYCGADPVALADLIRCEQARHAARTPTPASKPVDPLPS